MADAEEQPQKKSKLKWIILIFLILLILGGLAAGAWFFLMEHKSEEADGAQTGAVERQVVQTPGADPIGTTVPLPTFTVNLADPLGQRFIKISLEVELADPKIVQDMEKQRARIRDSIIMLLSSKSYADVASTESKMVLKAEIASRLSAILGQGKVYQVFITDMVIQ